MFFSVSSVTFHKKEQVFKNAHIIDSNISLSFLNVRCKIYCNINKGRERHKNVCNK